MNILKKACNSPSLRDRRSWQSRFAFYFAMPLTITHAFVVGCSLNPKPHTLYPKFALLLLALAASLLFSCSSNSGDSDDVGIIDSSSSAMGESSSSNEVKCPASLAQQGLCSSSSSVVVSSNSNEGSSGNSSFTDKRDGKTYSIKTFGTAVWMTENLMYNSATGKYSYEQAKTACPFGWRLPEGTEWLTLKDNLGRSAGDYFEKDFIWMSANRWEFGISNDSLDEIFESGPPYSIRCVKGLDLSQSASQSRNAGSIQITFTVFYYYSLYSYSHYYWGDTTGVINNICYGTVNNPTRENGVCRAFSGNSLTDSTLIDSTTYYYRTFVIDNENDTLRSSVGNFTTSGGVSVSSTNYTTAAFELYINGYGATSRGFCYGTNATPSKANSVCKAIPSLSGYQLSVSALSPSTKYYVKSYMEIGGETQYSKATESFTTKSLGITVTEKTDVSAKLNAYLPEASNYRECGFCYGANNNPSTLNGACESASGKDLVYSLLLSGLTKGATYYARAYCVNSEDEITYSQTQKFDRTIITDERDGKKYATVTIGEQTWMAENLNYASTGSKCYNDEITNCDKYGRLYNWVAAMNLNDSCNATFCANQIGTKHQGVCPVGWHLPSNAEWTTLTNYVGASAAGTKLKSAFGWYTSSGYIAGTDDFGFSALPGGDGRFDDSFYRVGQSSDWWSSTERANVSEAYGRSMSYRSEPVSGIYIRKSNFSSVRCLKD